MRRLQDALDRCEKILRTPLPLSYTRHTSRFLVMWLTCLPFVAWTELGWATVPVDVILVGRAADWVAHVVFADIASCSVLKHVHYVGLFTLACQAEQ